MYIIHVRLCAHCLPTVNPPLGIRWLVRGEKDEMKTDLYYLRADAPINTSLNFCSYPVRSSNLFQTPAESRDQ